MAHVSMTQSAERESAPPAHVLAQNTAMTRLEARLALEGAVEARVPRLIAKKPSIAGQPIGADSPRRPRKCSAAVRRASDQ